LTSFVSFASFFLSRCHKKPGDQGDHVFFIKFKREREDGREGWRERERERERERKKERGLIANKKEPQLYWGGNPCLPILWIFAQVSTQNLNGELLE
jgi:hypothetical protein